jgi:hypothetical protein
MSLLHHALRAAMHGLEPLVVTPLQLTQPPTTPLRAILGVVVFDRTRRSNGREEALPRPQPEALAALARHHVVTPPRLHVITLLWRLSPSPPWPT